MDIIIWYVYRYDDELKSDFKIKIRQVQASQLFYLYYDRFTYFLFFNQVCGNFKIFSRIIIYIYLLGINYYCLV